VEEAVNEVRVEDVNYAMPPDAGFTAALSLTVADIGRSTDFYATVFDGTILRRSLHGDGDPAFVQIGNTWLILTGGGSPTPDKPTVTLKTPNPDEINSFLNLRVADIQACYRLWKSRGAEFITVPLEKYGETRCYIRDPDGYIIEVGQSKPGFFDQPA
jgi:catechol 2,3-dioxygenase-like lactoylglutathione lyase family enzyme